MEKNQNRAGSNLIYENLGRSRQAPSEFEKLYAEDTNYEDVAVRLGLH